jgi:triacylglycerol esterase/lipase EstA (alpha/beta hydrolase family)
MDDPRIRLAHDSLALLSAAERLQQGAGDRACAPFLPAALECIEQSLYVLSRGCHAAAHALIPSGDLHASISWRYARAAADWPAALDGAGPSHERQAQLLASIHDTAAALRTAAARCARTRHLVAETMKAPASMTGLEHRSATPKAARRSRCAP